MTTSFVARLSPIAPCRDFKAAFGELFVRINDPSREDLGWKDVTPDQAEYLRKQRVGDGYSAPCLFEIKTKDQALKDAKQMKQNQSRGSLGADLERSEREAELEQQLNEQRKTNAETKALLETLQQMMLTNPTWAQAMHGQGAAMPSLGAGATGDIADPNAPAKAVHSQETKGTPRRGNKAQAPNDATVVQAAPNAEPAPITPKPFIPGASGAGE